MRVNEIHTMCKHVCFYWVPMAATFGSLEGIPSPGTICSRCGFMKDAYKNSLALIHSLHWDSHNLTNPFNYWLVLFLLAVLLNSSLN
jgi:hypothetical protein